MKKLLQIEEKPIPNLAAISLGRILFEIFFRRWGLFEILPARLFVCSSDEGSGSELGSINLDQADVAGVTAVTTQEIGTSRLMPLKLKRRRIQPPVHKQSEHRHLSRLISCSRAQARVRVYLR